MQNMQNQTISDLYADDNKSRISNNPQDIVKLVKNYYEKIYTKEAASAASTSKWFSKIYLMNNLTFVRRECL